MSLPRRDLDASEVLRALDPSLTGARLEEVGEGWDNVAFVVRRTGHEDLLLRLSKFADPAEREATVRTDVALLDFVGAHATLETNRVLASDPDVGALLLTLVPGHSADRCPPADPAGAAHDLGGFLARIHAADPPPGLVPTGRDLTLSHAEAMTAWEGAREVFDARTRAEVEAYLAEPLPRRPQRMVFCHNDLGDEHVIVDPATGRINGIIDWSDAVHDDPARDFALLLFDFGDDFFEGVLAAYGCTDDDLPARARWFAARAGVMGICFRAGRDDPGLATTLERLRSVIARRG